MKAYFRFTPFGLFIAILTVSAFSVLFVEHSMNPLGLFGVVIMWGNMFWFAIILFLARETEDVKVDLLGSYELES